MSDEKQRLEHFPVVTPIRLALLWAALMSLYIYNDYFVMYVPGTIRAMSEGKMGPLGQATPTVMVGAALLLAIPALMIFLSAALPPAWSKWLNVLLGAVYTVIEALTFQGPHLFYKIVVAIEIAVTLLIIVHALRWPRQSVPVRPA
ncbi:MAG: hypothetical protein KGO22_15795 [Gammaproteobacteria bacterium]|nr:hypothetical protein [Gammaproteobacteria bacterium]